MKSLIDKYKTQGIIIALCVLLGCVSGISGKELFPIHARPILPNALISPSETFLTCGDDYYCITPENLEALHGASLPREFHRQDMESIFKKKIKTRFPILFKRAVEFQMLKAKGRL